MNLPDQYFKIIIDEFEKVSKQCDEAKSLEDKLYFFSASYGVLYRVMNFSCDPILIFMHQILQYTHQGFTQRLSQLRIPGLISNSIPDVMQDALFSYFSELILSFKSKDEIKIREVLEKFSNLWYATNGNGFYLFLNKKLKI